MSEKPNHQTDNEQWTTIVTPKVSLFAINLANLWLYRDLILLFIRRDFVSIYKQTILGPLWYIVQPVLTTITFSVIFGNIANMPHGNIPGPIFYMSGLVFWNLFSSGVVKTSNTFINNANIFGKVYFPRLTVPISIIISNLIGFSIQLITFFAFLFYYYIHNQVEGINWSLFWTFPLMIIQISLMALGIGIIISSLTTKYRDFSFLIGFGIQLLMYCSPVVFPFYEVPDKYKIFILANPMSSMIMTFRSIFLSFPFPEQGFSYIMYSFGFTIVVLLVGLAMFNRVEKTFMDTV